MLKFTMDRKELAAALGIVKNAAIKSTVPILRHVAITANEKSVQFCATDLDMTITTRIECDVTKPGTTTVSAALLHQLVSALSSEEVTLTEVKDKLEITTGVGERKQEYELATLDAKEFPPAPRIEEGREFRMTTGLLRGALQATAFATSTDSSRYTLNGTHFKLNGCVHVVATDGRRLARVKLTPEDQLHPVEATIPLVTMKEVQRLLPDGDEKRATVTLGNNAARFVFGETTIVTRIIEGNYPNYEQVIPETKDKDGVNLSRTDLLSALKRLSLFSESCKLQFRGQILTVSAKGNGKDKVGSAVETLLIPKWRNLTITFNTGYLMEALNAVTDDEVRFFAADGLSPGVLKVKSREWDMVLMPMRETEAMDAQAAAAAAAAAEAAKATPETGPVTVAATDE